MLKFNLKIASIEFRKPKTGDAIWNSLIAPFLKRNVDYPSQFIFILTESI